MRPRIHDELLLLREQYPDVEHREHAGEDWFLLPRYLVTEGWLIGTEPIEVTRVCFRIGAAYPQGEPYGFFAPAGMNFRGSPPGNPGGAVAVPFAGEWLHFSWQADGSWAPTDDVRTGSNLLVWARSFGTRLREGA